jgi:hypothetical protein
MQSYEEKLKQYESEADDRRNDGFTSKLTRAIRTSGMDDTFRRIGVLRHEVDTLKMQLDQANKATSENKRRYREYADSLNAEKSITSKQRYQIDDLKSRLISLERAKEAVEHSWSAVSQENEHLRFRLQKTENDLASVDMIKNDIAGQLNNAQRVAEKASTTLEQKEALLESRTKELRAAESYITKYDNVAGEDVLGLVQELNLKILDIAAAVSGGVRVRAGTRSLPPVDASQMNALSKIVGASLLRHLRDKDHSNDPTLIQLAIQVALVTLVYQFCTTWPFPSLNLPKHPLWSVYEHIRAYGMYCFSECSSTQVWYIYSACFLRQNSKLLHLDGAP